MNINHINLTVKQVQETRIFLEKYLGMKSMEGTTDDATFIALSDGERFVLTLMQAPAGKEVIYPVSFHVGFLKQGEQKVQEIYVRLKDDGYDISPPRPHRNGKGSDLYFLIPGGFMVQISA